MKASAVALVVLVAAGCMGASTYPHSFLASGHAAPDGLVLAGLDEEGGWTGLGLRSNPGRVDPADVGFLEPALGDVAEVWVAFLVEPAAHSQVDPHVLTSWAIRFHDAGAAQAWALATCHRVPEDHRLLVTGAQVALLAPAGGSELVQSGTAGWAEAITAATGASDPC